MNKKLSIFAIVLIVLGIIGSIFSGIQAMPFFIDVVTNTQKEMNRETNVYNQEVNINKIDISTLDVDVVVKKHNKKNVVINEKGINKNVKLDINSNENILSVKQLESDKNYNIDIKDLEDLLNFAVENMYYHDNNSIIIYVPNDVDINVITSRGSLKIEDDIFLENLVYKTSRGYLTLPKNVIDLPKLDIKSNGDINLSIAEIIGIKDINIEAAYVNIYSDDRDIFIDDIESYLPNNLTINQMSSNDAYNNISINTDIPVAKNLTINGYKSEVSLDLPIEKYKINFDIKALENISLEGLVNKNIISQDSMIYENIREINGILNKQLENLEKQYNVSVKSQNVNIY